MNEPTRLMIADDHPLIRAGLRALLSAHDDLAVVGEAADGAEAVAVWDQSSPDVGLFDLRMPTLDGVQALLRIRQRQPQAAVVILTSMVGDADIDRVVRAGARPICRRMSIMETPASAGAPERPVRAALLKSRLAGRVEDADRARGRGAERHRARLEQPARRRRAGDRRGNGQDAPQAHLRQAVRAQPHRGGGDRAPEGAAEDLAAGTLRSIRRSIIE